jgi:hypothetical protein
LPVNYNYDNKIEEKNAKIKVKELQTLTKVLIFESTLMSSSTYKSTD